MELINNENKKEKIKSEKLNEKYNEKKMTKE